MWPTHWKNQQNGMFTRRRSRSAGHPHSLISLRWLTKDPSLFLGWKIAGNATCFRSGEEEMKIPGSVAYSSGHHITPKSTSNSGPWNCSRWDTFFFKTLRIVACGEINWDISILSACKAAYKAFALSLNTPLYGPRQAKSCLRACAKCRFRVFPRMRNVSSGHLL